jgi:hypothetical protein
MDCIRIAFSFWYYLVLTKKYVFKGIIPQGTTDLM